MHPTVIVCLFSLQFGIEENVQKDAAKGHIIDGLVLLDGVDDGVVVGTVELVSKIICSLHICCD